MGTLGTYILLGISPVSYGIVSRCAVTPNRLIGLKNTSSYELSKKANVATQSVLNYRLADKPDLDETIYHLTDRELDNRGKISVEIRDCFYGHRDLAGSL